MPAVTKPAESTSSAFAYKWKVILFVLGVGLSLFQLWSVVLSTVDPLLQRAIFLSWVLALAFWGLRFGRSGGRELPSKLDLAEGLLVILAGLHYAYHFTRIQNHWPMIDPLTTADLAVGGIVFFLVLDMTRRVVGWPIVVIAGLFTLYALLGHVVPGSFSHRSFSVGEFLDQMVFTINGIFGAPLAVAATYVYLFVLFGIVLYHSGAGEFFISLAKALAAGARGGAAKVAVISCGLFGMISGSPTSDAVTTGTFTIPLMKRMGYKAVEAGAIVAVAATGGSIMPPVMGSAAFLMSEFTGIRYIRIAIAAAVPAILYYLGVMAQVHFQALRKNVGGLRGEDEPGFWSLCVRNLQFFIPLGVLVVMMVQGQNPTHAAAVAIMLTLAVSWVRRETRMGLRKIAMALEESARAAVVVVAATAAAGILVGTMGMTGVGGKFTGLLFEAAGETLFIALLITMVVCIVLGMGMPVPSAYILTAVVAAPALVRLGVPTLPAHLFILYFAVMSAITPPVAVAAFAAAGIAGANPNQIGYRAVRLGIVAFIVPFLFVYQPELLLIGEPLAVALAIPTAALGVIALAAGLEGWLLMQAAWWERVLLAGGGLLMIVPGFYTDVAGLVLAAIPLVHQWRQGGGAVTAALR
jgi:TRAP transporter 4TM/12TM fusion protein